MTPSFIRTDRRGVHGENRMSGAGVLGARTLGVLFVVLWIFACGSDTAGPGSNQDVDHRFWGVSLKYRAITLSTFAPYDTIRLVATPVDAFGDPLSAPLRDNAVSTFVVSNPTDTNFVLDSLTGLLRARHAEQGIVVRIRMTVDGVTRADSVLVNITDVRTPPVFARIALQVTPSDTLFQLNPFAPIPAITARALDSEGDPIDGATFAFWSSNSGLFRVSSDGGIQRMSNTPVSHGRAMAFVSATVYGVTRIDSIPITVTLPYFTQIYVRWYTPKGSLTPVGSFVPPVDSVAPGALLGWALSGVTDSIDVTFDDPSNVDPVPLDSPFSFFATACNQTAGGNIPTWAIDSTKVCANSTQIRYFSKPGTYHYHSERYGTTGTIVVQ